MLRSGDLPNFDGRPTVRLHQGMPEKGSVAALSDSAFRLLIEAICYCGREESNGRVPSVILNRLATKRTAIKELVDRGHMESVDADTWFLTDYLRWNRSDAEIQAFRESKAQSGVLGAHNRWHVPRRQRVKDCPHCYPVKGVESA
ncbi:hypothetical protein CLV29_2529 [Naumannella halotolerans]|uniref:Uncharacterized protein n=2 Tax=Naumannella halotolerans TaxID=993414 RepID=A0A4R7J3M8_9ACTN|nr:hypothetical protein CLV29_2529 [Naumannella halotolerans]